MKTVRVTKDRRQLFYFKKIAMRFYFIFLMSCLFSSEARSQDSTDYHRFASSIDVIYGQKYFQNHVVDITLNSLDQSSFGHPISYIGVGRTELLEVNRKYLLPVSLNIGVFLPQKVTIQDTISGRVSGFNFGITVAGVDVFMQKRWIDLILGAGFKAGRIRLYDHPSLEHGNGYFSPFVSLNPRINIGRISIQFKAEYELDLSRAEWNYLLLPFNYPIADLAPMKSTGLTISFSVGWVLD